LRWQAGKLHPYPRLLKPLGGFAALGRARAARFAKRFAVGPEKCDVLSRKTRRSGIGFIPGFHERISPGSPAQADRATSRPYIRMTGKLDRATRETFGAARRASDNAAPKES
jgi:hypothetical protein